MLYGCFRAAIYALEIVLAYCVQQTPGLIPEVYGARPLLVVPAIFSIAAFEGKIAGLLLGTLAGALLDVGLSSRFGPLVIVVGLLGYFCGFVAEKYRTEKYKKVNFLTFFAGRLALVPAVTFFRFYLYCASREIGDLYYAFVYHAAPCAVYTLAICPIGYFFNRFTATFLREKGSERYQELEVRR